MRKFIWIICSLICFSCVNKQTEEAPAKVEKVNIYGFDTDTLSVDSLKVKSGQVFASLFQDYGLSYAQTYQLKQATDSIFPARMLRAGNNYNIYYQSDTLGNKYARYMIYEKDKLSLLVFQCFEPYSAWCYEKPIIVEEKTAEVTIENSLWVDFRKENASPLLILKLSDIYAWTVDFFALAKGDKFRLAYKQSLVDSNVVSIDTIYVAQYIRGVDTLKCYMYDLGDNGNIYWNEKGESMRKTFLKAPLHFSRISSGFSYARKHPVTRRVQPHTGVDYAAPKGTPVMSIGDGVVLSAKYEGAGGNTVRIRHNSVYTTAYLHLSGYGKNIKAGTRVQQGQVIGYVGSTGRSTGPHLDFRVWKNGSPINPLKMESPPAEPLPKETMPAFELQKTKLDSLLIKFQ